MDYWSLGATLYEMMVAKRLVGDPNSDYEARNPEQKWDKMKVRMENYEVLVSKLLRKDPRRRLTAEDFFRRVKETN